MKNGTRVDSSSSSSSSESENEDASREEHEMQKPISETPAPAAFEEMKQSGDEESPSGKESFVEAGKSNETPSTDKQLNAEDESSSESENEESQLSEVAKKDPDASASQIVHNPPPTLDSEDSSNHEHDDPSGTNGEIDKNSSDSEDNVGSHHSSSDPEVEDDRTPVVTEPQRPISPSNYDRTSISSNSSLKDEKPPQKHLKEVDEHEDRYPSAALPMVLDSSDSSHDELIPEVGTVDIPPQNDNDTHDSISDKKSDDSGVIPKSNSLHEKEPFATEDDHKPISRRSSSSSSSSSSSESDGEPGPLVIKQTEEAPDRREVPSLSSRKDKEMEVDGEEEEYAEGLGARKPSERATVVYPTALDYDYMESYSPEAFDFDGDPSVRARTAFDFEDAVPDVPPALPSKQRDITSLAVPDINVQRRTYNDWLPDRPQNTSRTVDVHPNIFHVNDNVATYGRGMWSDDEDKPVGSRQPVPTHHPPADRVIDFSTNPDGDHSLKRSRSGRKRSLSRKRSKDNRSRSPSAHRVVDFSGNPHEYPPININSQTLVSLRSNAYESDAYDTVPETGDELNKLIEKANSLAYYHYYPDPAEDVFPKKKLREKKLESKHPDAFAKIVAPIPVHSLPPQTHLNNHQNSDNSRKQHRSLPRKNQKPQALQVQPSDRLVFDNSRKPNRSLPRKRQRSPPPRDALDGDDEISFAESEVERFVSPPIQNPEPSIPFVTEIYPSDYTDFEVDTMKPDNLKSSQSFMSDDTIYEAYSPPQQTVRQSAYETGPDMETDAEVSPKAKLNPIVSSNFQICSDISGSKSFPARLREGKPKKERPGLEVLAIPLNQASKNRNQYPTSLPYFANDFTDDESDFDKIRRTGSVDDIPGIYPVVNPNIVVHRQATHPKGYRPDVVPEIVVQKAPSLPEKKKKKKKKKEKKGKKIPDDKPVPQINLKVDGESSNLNNDLQINLLPSDDPNIINLNIRSTSVVPPGPTSMPVIIAQPQPYQPAQPAPQHPQPFASPVDRVVDISAPPMVITGNEFSPSEALFHGNGGVMLAGGVPTEIRPNPILASASQQFNSSQAPQNMPLYPTMSLAPPKIEPETALVSTQSLPASAAPPPVVKTPETEPPVQQPPLQPNNEASVVDIQTPWPLPEERNSSLPAKSSSRINRGDSGIDLTIHDKNRRPRSRTPKTRRRRSRSRSVGHRDLSSSSDRGSKRRRLPSSQRKLQSEDYLANIGPSNEYLEWYKNKYLKPSCCYLFMKHLMFVINLIFTLVGLALVGLGVWGMVDLHQKGGAEPEVIFLDPLFTVMAVGFIVTLVSFHGAAGFIRDSICMLKCFGSLLVMLFILFACGGIVTWIKISSVETFTVSTYSRLIQQYNPESRVGLSYSIDLMQNTFECCGIAEPGSSQWVKNDLYKCQGTKCLLPDSCCQKTQDSKFVCRSSSDLKHQKACIDAMSITVQNQTSVIVGVWIGIWALMMVELICIYFMCKEIAYFQKIRDLIRNPKNYMKPRQELNSRRSSVKSVGTETSPSSDSETSCSGNEYRRRRQKNNKKRVGKKRKTSKRRRGSVGKRSVSGRRQSYTNQKFSMEDERRSSRGRRSQRGNHRGSSRSRSRRGSY